MSRIKISRVVANVLDNSFLTVLSNNIVATLLTTSNVAEGANLYFSNTRARAAVGSANQSTLIYYEANGNFQVNVETIGSVTSVNGQSGTVTLTTANIAEGANLYFTNARAQLAAIPAVNQIVVTTPVFNYNFDQYVGDNPSIYVTAGETISFELIQGASHPFAIRVSNGGSNYNTGLTHVDTDGTVTTGSGAQGKYTGKLFWKIPYELAGNTYVYQCTNHSSMVGNIVIQPPQILLTTSNIAEGSNLYFTNARARAAVGAVGSNLVYYEANGNFQVIVSTGGGGAVDSVNGQTGTVVLTTANIAESGNLYYTDTRVWANVGANIGNLNAWTDSNSSNIGNLNSWIRTLSTTGIAEGANLYFTNARVYSALYNSSANTTPIAAQSIFLQDGASNGIIFDSPNAADYANISVQTNAGATYLTFYVGDNTADLFKFYAPSSNNGLQFNDQVVWHAGNDGAGSGLDADLLDNNNSSYYTLTTNHTEGTNLFFTNTRVRAAVGAVGSNLTYYEANGNYQVTVPGSNQQVVFNNNGQLGASTGMTWDGSSFKATLLESTQSSGDEGGQLTLANAVTNSTLNGPVAIDIYQDKLRIFETGGSNRGAFIPLNSAAIGVGSNLLAGGGGGGAVDSVNGLTGTVVLTTANIAESGNLYFTNTRARAAVNTAAANAKGISYVESTGEFSLADSGVTAGTYGNATLIPSVTVDRYGRITNISNVVNGGGGGGTVSSINGQTGAVVLTTTDIAEGSNLYYTDNRVWANVGANIGNINSWIPSLTTASIAEANGNLYYTNARARAAITTAAANAKGLSYVESTGEFSLADSGATAATYGGASQIPAVVVDRYGRITAASNVALSGSGTVTGFNFTGGIVTVTNPNTVPSLTVAGTSGGVVYFSSSSTWASSGALAASAIVIGGGAGNAPSTTTTGTGVLTAIGNAVNTNGGLVTQAGTLTSSTLLIGGGSGSGIGTTTTGTGVLTALGVSVGSSGAFVVNGGALGTPTSGTVTNLTGTASININGTVGATTPAAGQFTSLVASGLFTANTTAEVVTALSGATGVVTHNTALSAVFYHTSPAANFTANFTNVPTTDNRVINVTLVIVQGATPYICNAVQINGAAQTIRWQGGSAPTGTGSRWEVMNFSLIDVGASWTVLGALYTHG